MKEGKKMEFVISKKNLLKMLNMASEAAQYSGASMPKEMLIVAGYDQLYLMVRNSDFSISIETHCNVLEVGTIIVEAVNFIEIINDIDEGEIKVKELPNNVINISSENTDVNLITQDITTYQLINSEKKVLREIS